MTHGWFRTRRAPVDEHDHYGEPCKKHAAPAGECCPCCSGWAPPQDDLEPDYEGLDVWEACALAAAVRAGQEPLTQSHTRGR